MSKSLIISARAKKNLAVIMNNIADYTKSPSSVSKLAKDFSHKFAQIASFPKACPSLSDGTRQTFCRRYRIVYRESEHHIEIITVVHSLQKYP